MGLLKSVGKAAARGLDLLSGVVTNPIIAITKGTNESAKKFKEQTPGQTAVKTITNLGAVAAVATGAGVLAGVGRAGSIATKIGSGVISGSKSLLPKSTKGKIIGAVAVPVGLGIVAKAPAKSAETILNAPSELAKFGSDVGSFINEPSVKTAKEILTESPLISGAIGLAVGGGLVKAILPAIGSARQTEAIQEQTEAIKGITISPQPLQEQLYSNTPLTPQVRTVSTISSVGTRRKRTKKKEQKPMSIKQNVNVVVQNKATSTGLKLNKKYIKETLYN